VADTGRAERIKDIASIAGVRNNQLVGYGIVVGLDGSGDQTTQTPFTVQSMISMLSAMGVNLPPGQSLQLKNVAAVMVTASLPPFARAGQPIDITVSSIGNAKSLKGGTLILTPLKGADGQIYAMAQGNVTVVVGAGRLGRRLQGHGESSVGRPHRRRRHGRARSADAAGAGRVRQSRAEQHRLRHRATVVEAINRMAPGTARQPMGARSGSRHRPTDERVSFIGRIEGIEVTPVKMAAKVIVNSRTGSVVMNQAVLLETAPSPTATCRCRSAPTMPSASRVRCPADRPLRGQCPDRDQAGRRGLMNVKAAPTWPKSSRAELAGRQPAGPDRHPAGDEIGRRAARRAGNHLKLDQQWAQVMTEGGGTGLARVMERQLAANAGSADTSKPIDLKPLSDAGLFSGLPFQPPTARNAAFRQSLQPGAAEPVASAIAGLAADQPPPTSAGAPAHARAFVERVWPAALSASRATGIPAQFLVAQAALETGWGRAELTAADGSPSNNLFNIKAGSNCRGKPSASRRANTSTVAGRSRTMRSVVTGRMKKALPTTPGCC
jgi:flagellar basal body P-ring protein FlgI/flagellum-specific peptidoglycan hydrolase FlgJ